MANVKMWYPINNASGSVSNMAFATHAGFIDLTGTPMKKKARPGDRRADETQAQKNFREADLLYQQFPQSRRDQWRKAVKKPHVSAYALWMKECMTCFHSGRNAPIDPSISGGYSGAKVVCNSLIPPPT